MNSQDFNQRLIWYSLNLLEEPARQALEAELAGSPELQAEFLILSNLIAQVGYSATPLDPSPLLKQRLLSRIQSEPVILKSADLPWIDHPVMGVKVAILYTNPWQRTTTALFQADAGVYYPYHRHVGPEEIYMISGDLIIHDLILTAGDYIRSLPPSYHPHATATGCVCWVHSCLDDEFLEAFNTQPGSFADDNPSLEGSEVMRAQNLSWQPYATTGVEVAVLSQSSTHITGLLKASPGTVYPLHQHAEVEEILMLSGDLIVENYGTLGPGDYLRSGPGSRHSPATEQGCCFLFQTSPHDQFVFHNPAPC